MKTEKAHLRGSEAESESDRDPKAADQSEIQSDTQDSSEPLPTDRPSKIQSIIGPILAEEIQHVEREIKLSTERLEVCNLTCDRLRACITAKFYCQAGQNDVPTSLLGPPKQSAIHPATRYFVGKRPTEGESTSAASATEENVKRYSWKRALPASATCSQTSLAKRCQTTSSAARRSPSQMPQPPEVLEVGRDSRHKFKKKIIFGNVSRYLNPEKTTDTDGCLFKWKVYLSLDKGESGKIEDFVRRVTFYLHDSYSPNIVSVNYPPFELTKRGWGEFQIRADLHFLDKRNATKPVFHELKFGSVESKYGVQLKQETAHVIELFREVPLGIPSSTTSRARNCNKRKVSNASPEISHVTISHDPAPEVQIKQEANESELAAHSSEESAAKRMRLDASPDAVDGAMRETAGSAVFKTPLIVKTELGSSGGRVLASSDSNSATRDNLESSRTEAVSILRPSEGGHLIVRTAAPSILGQTVSVVDGRTVSTVVLSNGTSTLPKKVTSVTVRNPSAVGSVSSNGKSHQTSLLRTLPLGTGGGVAAGARSVLLPGSRMAVLQNMAAKSQGAVTHEGLVADGDAVLGRSVLSLSGGIAGSAVNAAGACLVSTPGKKSGAKMQIVQQAVAGGSGNQFIVLSADRKMSKTASAGPANNKDKVLVGARLVADGSASKPTMLVFDSPSGVPRAIPIQFLNKKVTVTSTASTTGPSQTMVLGSTSVVAPGLQKSLLDKTVSSGAGAKKLWTGMTVASPSGSGGSSVLVSSESDDVDVDVVSCPVACTPSKTRTSGTAGSRVEQFKAAMSPRGTDVSGSGNLCAGTELRKSQTETCSGEGAKSASVVVVASPALHSTASASGRVVLKSSCDLVPATSVSDSPRSDPGRPAVQACSSSSPGESETGSGACSSPFKDGARSQSITAAASAQSSVVPAVSLQRTASPNCSALTSQSDSSLPPSSSPSTSSLSFSASSSSSLSSSLSSLSSSSSSTSLSPPKAVPVMMAGPSSTVTKTAPPSSPQVSCGIPAMCPFKVTSKGLKMVTSSAKPLPCPSANSTKAVPQTMKLTFPLTGNHGMSQTSARTPPSSSQTSGSQALLASMQGQTFLLKLSPPEATAPIQRGPERTTALSSKSSASSSMPALYNGLDSLRLAQGDTGSDETKRIIGYRPVKKGLTEQVPEVAPLSISEYSSLKSLVRASVRVHPLIQTGVDRSLHPYCAFDENHWLSWPLAKRRASEWQRASTVRRFIQKMVAPREEFHGEKLWSTKQTLVWCRLHALSPYILEPRRKKAKVYEGTNSSQERDQAPPLAVNVREVLAAAGIDDHQQTVSDLLDAGLEDDGNDNDVEIVEYYPGFNPQGRIKAEIKEEPGNPIDCHMCPTEEEWFIRDNAEQVNVKLRSTELEPGCLVPAVERMMFSVMKQFATNLIQESHAVSKTRDSNSREITVRDVSRAVASQGSSDFFSGLELETEVTNENEFS